MKNAKYLFLLFFTSVKYLFLGVFLESQGNHETIRQWNIVLQDLLHLPLLSLWVGGYGFLNAI